MGNSIKSRGSIKQAPGTAMSGLQVPGAVTAAKGAPNGQVGRGISGYGGKSASLGGSKSYSQPSIGRKMP